MPPPTNDQHPCPRQTVRCSPHRGCADEAARLAHPQPRTFCPFTHAPLPWLVSHLHRHRSPVPTRGCSRLRLIRWPTGKSTGAGGVVAAKSADTQLHTLYNAIQKRTAQPDPLTHRSASSPVETAEFASSEPVGPSALQDGRDEGGLRSTQEGVRGARGTLEDLGEFLVRRRPGRLVEPERDGRFERFALAVGQPG